MNARVQHGTYDEPDSIVLRIERGLPALAYAQYALDGSRIRAGQGICAPTSEELEEWDAMAPALCARVIARDATVPRYIRFGRPPRSGRSRNHATGQWLPGVSALRAEYDPVTDTWRVAPDACDVPSWLFLWAAGLPAYLLAGEETGYRGGDGESIIREPRVLARLAYTQGAGVFRVARARSA